MSVAVPNSTVRSIDPLLAELRAVGCKTNVNSDIGELACGLTVLFDVQQHLAGVIDTAKLAQRIRRQLDLGGAVGLTLCNFDGVGDPIETLEKACYELRDAGVPRCSRIEIYLRSGLVPPQAFSLITRRLLGYGKRFAQLNVVPAPTPRDCQNERVSDDWSFVWRHRSGPWAVLPAYASHVYTMCPLLSEQVAAAVLPAFAMQAPAGSAWLPLRLDVTRYAGTDGEVCIAALEGALRDCIDAADRILDELRWISPETNSDAAANRRIAVLVDGFGDLVAMQKRDPTQVATQRDLLQLASHIHKTLWRRSGELARALAPAPAIERGNPARNALDNAAARAWSVHWQASVSRNAVRHRNLLVMSPYSVLPSRPPYCAGYADLLPLIGVADAWSFATPAAFSGWKPNEFKQFHRRAAAVIARRGDNSVVATMV